MGKFFLFLLYATLLSADIARYSPDYTPENSITSHIKASGREVSASFQKMMVKVREGQVRDPYKKAVLLIHGLNSSPKDWHMLIDDLKNETFEVYTIYLSYWEENGFNKSVKKIQDKARAILETHATLNVVGHSLGGVAATEAVNQLGLDKRRVKCLITVNSPLNGTTVLNGFTRLFIPAHLVEVLTYQGDFVTRLQSDSLDTKRAGVRIYHTATESDHLVRDISTCFLPHYDEGIVVRGQGHLSTLNCPTVRRKILEWLNL